MGLRIDEVKSKWISVKDEMPNKPQIVKVKIDDGQEFEGFVCRNGKGEWTIQPWDEMVEFWKPIEA